MRELSGILDSLGVDERAELVSGLNIVNYLGQVELGAEGGTMSQPGAGIKGASSTLN